MSAITEPRPPFGPGESGVAGGVEYRVETGRKGPGDMVLKLRAPGWVAVGMDFSGLLADFHNQVEDILYPKTLGKKGGGKFFEHLALARKHGWRFAAAILASEKALRHIHPPQQQIPYDWGQEGDFR